MSKSNRKRWLYSSKVWKLIQEQRRDMNNKDYVDNNFDPKSTDIYHRRRKSPGPGYRRK